MDYSYAESSVKRHNGVMEILYRILWITVCIYLDIFLIAINTMGIILIALICVEIYGFFIFNGRLNVEYEYIFCDGQIDFDVIKAGRKRKHILRVELNNAVYLAPYQDEEIINNKNVRTVCNYWSRKHSAKLYALIIKKNDRLFKILFEPNDKFLECMRLRMPRKCKFYPQEEVVSSNKDNQ